MAEVVKFKKEHLKNLDEHVFGISVKENMSEAMLKILEKREHCYSILKGETVLGCVGVTEFWQDRAEVWAILKKDMGMDFIEVNSACKKLVAGLPMKRLEAVVNADFEAGIRWMRALGFRLESARMKNYGRDGKDCMLFAKVKDA